RPESQYSAARPPCAPPPARPWCCSAARSRRPPRFVVAGGRRPPAALIVVPRRAIGLRRAGQIGDMGLLPGTSRPRVERRLGHVVMQPGVPFGRHPRRLLGAVINDPAAPPLPRPRLALLIIPVAEAVRADRLALEQGKQPGADAHAPFLLRPARL